MRDRGSAWDLDILTSGSLRDMIRFTGAGYSQPIVVHCALLRHTHDRLRFFEKLPVGSIEILCIFSSELQVLCLIMSDGNVRRSTQRQRKVDT